MSNREIASLFWFFTLMVFVVYKSPAIVESLKSLETNLGEIIEVRRTELCSLEY